MEHYVPFACPECGRIGRAKCEAHDSPLIAAAPDLLEALQRIAEMGWSSLCAKSAAEDMQAIAWEAIRKAEK